MDKKSFDDFIIPPHLCTPARYQMQRVLPKVLDRPVIDSDSFILDLGCGTGFGRFFFKAGKYIGIDMKDHDFPLKIDKGKRFILGDIRKLPLKENSIDLIFAHGVLQYNPEDYEIIIQEIYRVLKKRAECYIMVPSNLERIFSQFFFLPFIFKKKVVNQKYFGKREFLKLVREKGFFLKQHGSTCSFFMGFFTFVYYLRIITRFLKRNKNLHRGFYFLPADVVKASNSKELIEIFNKEVNKLNLSNKIYVKILEILYSIDKKVRIPFNFENYYLITKAKDV